MASQRLADLTILMRMIDKTRQTMEGFNKRIDKVANNTNKMRLKWVAVGGVIGFVLKKAIDGIRMVSRVGGELLTRLSRMGDQLNITGREAEALFNAIREGDPTATIDKVNEAMLTLQERLSDARISGSGPFGGLLKDIEGFDLDLGLDNPRANLANFLELVDRLPQAKDKIFALKDVLGDDDALAFINMINNGEKLSRVITDLRTDVKDLANVMSASEEKELKEYREATARLQVAWENFSKSVFKLIAPMITAINKGATFLLDRFTAITSKLNKLRIEAMTNIEELVSSPIPDDIASIDALQEKAQTMLAKVENDIKERTEKLTGPLAALYRFSSEKEIELYNRQQLQIQKLNELSDALLFKRKALAEQSNMDSIGSNLGDGIGTPDANVTDDDEDDISGTTAFVTGRINMFNAVRDAQQEAFDKMKEQRDAENADAKAFADKQRSAYLSIGNVFGMLANIFGEKSKGAFKIFKSVQAALSLVSAYSAATQALAEAKGDPLLRLAAYAKLLAVGLGAVKSINQVEVGNSAPSTPSESGSGSAPQVGTGIGSAATSQATNPDAVADDASDNSVLNLNIEGFDLETTLLDPTNLRTIAEGLMQLGVNLEVNGNAI